MAIVRFPTAVTAAAAKRRKQAKDPRQRAARGSGGTARRIAGRHRGGTTCRLTHPRTRRAARRLTRRSARRAARRRAGRAARGSGRGATILRLARRSGAKHTLEQPAAGAAGQHAAHQAEKDDSSGHLRFPICKSKKHKRQRCHRQQVCRCPAVIQGRHNYLGSHIGQRIGRIEKIIETGRSSPELTVATGFLPSRCDEHRVRQGPCPFNGCCPAGGSIGLRRGRGDVAAGAQSPRTSGHRSR